MMFPLFYKEHLIFWIRVLKKKKKQKTNSKLLKFTLNTLQRAVMWQSASYRPQKCYDLPQPCVEMYILIEKKYSMKGKMYPMNGEGFFRNVYFSFMMIMIVGGVWFLICAKDILNLINNHCNKIFAGWLSFSFLLFFSSFGNGAFLFNPEGARVCRSQCDFTHLQISSHSTDAFLTALPWLSKWCPQ